MTIEEKRRELFESNMSAKLLVEGYALGTIPLVMSRGSNGEYSAVRIRGAWDGFNYVLDSVLIEFPEKFLDDHGGAAHDAEIYDGAIDECRAAIGSTGLGIKFK